VLSILRTIGVGTIIQLTISKRFVNDSSEKNVDEAVTMMSLVSEPVVMPTSSPVHSAARNNCFLFSLLRELNFDFKLNF